MSLVKCPECNKEISDKAKCCPNCGYELPKQEHIYQGIYCPKCLKSVFRTDEYERCPLCKVEMINSIQGTFKEVYGYGDNHPELKNSPEFDEQAYQRRINWVPIEYGNDSNNKPKCPSCQSTNLSKISSVGKAAKIGLFGLFGAGDIGKTYKCNNCGVRF